MRFLGLDLGDRRVGIAISDKTNTIATPFKTIYFEDLFNELKTIIEKEQITHLILGFPKNMNNTIGESADKVLDIKEKMKHDFDLDIELQDERRTTILANEYMLDSNMDRRKRKKAVDAAAAAIILQTYLDRRNENERRNK